MTDNEVEILVRLRAIAACKIADEFTVKEVEKLEGLMGEARAAMLACGDLDTLMDLSSAYLASKKAIVNRSKLLWL